MKTMLLAILLAATCSACNDDDHATRSKGAVANPSDIAVERLEGVQVKLTWKDNSDDETGFAIWVRRASDATDRKKVATLPADATECVVSEGLSEGESFYFGVQAEASSAERSSRVIYALFKMEKQAELPAATLVGEAISTPACIALSYRVSNIEGMSGVTAGLCWSADAVPTTADACQAGPELPKDGSAVLQAIPNALLEYGKTYKVRAYVTVPKGTYYSRTAEVSLGAAPAEIRLDWKKVEKSGLPAEIALYETTDPLNGRNFHAWYAVADLSKGNVELRANVPAAATTIDDQAAAFGGDCYVMVNGGYFYNGKHTGLAVVDGKASGTVPAVRGSLKIEDTEEYASMYNVTRGLFGVDASGKAAAYWAGTDPSGKAWYFDRPLPSVKGEAKYEAVSDRNPAAAVTWTPRYALSAGPVLLRDGKCPFDFTLTARGADYYLSNFEIMPYDIFGATVSPDRTAAGRCADGRVILFICDGRIAASGGATLTELAQIMKGLGCVDAVNFDGGGSTGMVVGGEHLNDLTGGNRPVVSTLGFFRKQ